MPLTRQQIDQKLRDRKVPTELVPFLDDQVIVQAISPGARDTWEWDNVKQRAANGGEGVLRNVRARLCVLAMVDEQGGRLYKDEDADMLGASPGLAKDLDAVYEVATRLAGISKETREEIEKNLPSAPGASSPSA